MLGSKRIMKNTLKGFIVRPAALSYMSICVWFRRVHYMLHQFRKHKRKDLLTTPLAAPKCFYICPHCYAVRCIYSIWTINLVCINQISKNRNKIDGFALPGPGPLKGLLFLMHISDNSDSPYNVTPYFLPETVSATAVRATLLKTRYRKIPMKCCW